MDFIVTCFALLLLYFCLIIDHFPKQRVADDENLVRLIRENGLIHFTALENSGSILKNGLLPCRKRTVSFLEKDFTWCYIYDENKVKEYINDGIFKENKDSKKGDGRKCEVGIRIEGITDEQICRMRYRRSKGFVAYKGNLKTDKMSIITF